MDIYHRFLLNRSLYEKKSFQSANLIDIIRIYMD